ncbi:hypothetical protein ACF1DY_26345 [Streptomyces albus]
MASVIDPERHADLIEKQLAVFRADAELQGFTGDDGERPAMRERLRQAAAAKDAALEESGLVTEHGWYTAEQDLKRAARAAERS